jgi:hypothetical protein
VSESCASHGTDDTADRTADCCTDNSTGDRAAAGSGDAAHRAICIMRALDDIRRDVLIIIVYNSVVTQIVI